MSRLNARQTAVFAAIAVFAVTGAILAGATQRSDSDPRDHTSPGITIPRHWRIVWPFDAKATGLPTTHRDAGDYIMWFGKPYAHMHHGTA